MAIKQQPPPAVVDRGTFFLRPELKTVDVEINGLGRVRLREFGAATQISLCDKFVAHAGKDTREMRGPDAIEFFADVLAESLVDEDGLLLCTQPGDRDRLKDMSVEVLQQLADAALDLNGLAEDDEEPDAGNPT